MGHSFFLQIGYVTAYVISSSSPKSSEKLRHHLYVTNIVGVAKIFVNYLSFTKTCGSMPQAFLYQSYLLLTFSSMSFICFTTLSGAVMVT